MTSLKKLVEQTKASRTVKQPPTPATTKKDGTEQSVFFSWIDTRDYDPDQSEDRPQTLTEEQLNMVEMELVGNMKTSNTTVINRIIQHPHKTLEVVLENPKNKPLEHIFDEKHTYGKELSAEDFAVVLVRQESDREGNSIPTSGPTLTIEARWHMNVLLDEENAGELGIDPEEGLPLTRLDDEMAKKDVLINLYSRSSASLMDGIRLVDVQILPENRLVMTFVGRDGVDIGKEIGKIAGMGGFMDTFSTNAIAIHEPIVHINDDDSFDVRYDPDKATQAPFDVELPKESPYRIPEEKFVKKTAPKSKTTRK